MIVPAAFRYVPIDRISSFAILPGSHITKALITERRLSSSVPVCRSCSSGRCRGFASWTSGQSNVLQERRQVQRVECFRVRYVQPYKVRPLAPCARRFTVRNAKGGIGYHTEFLLRSLRNLHEGTANLVTVRKL